MKKILGILTLTLAVYAVNAQSFTGPSPMGNYSTDGGIITFKSWMVRTGIGAAWGGYNDLYASGYLGFNIAHEGPTLAQPWNYLGDGGSNNGGNAIIGTVGGEMLFVAKPSNGGSGANMSNDDIRANIRMRLTPDGKFVIGKSYVNDAMSTPGNYNLYVENGILAEKVRVAVKNSGDWADYAFAPNYKMMPLKQLEDYIEQNKHLPGVPSAQEVVKDGVDLQQMDATLLQKVEELTLIAIKQQKEIAQQQQEIEALKAQQGKRQ